MKVSGFSFIRNAIKYDFPVVESLKSILPLCDEVVLAVGKSEDETLSLVQSIDPKIRIIETEWDDSLKGGHVLKMETDKALKEVASDSVWALYIQGDEVIHEKDLEIIRKAMEKYKDDPQVDGLLFNYIHFYGSYDYVGNTSNWYDKEIRVIRNNKNIYSYRDAQGFRKDDNQKLSVKPIDAYIYHYGWVKDPRVLREKLVNSGSFYHEGKAYEKLAAMQASRDFEEIDSLALFTGTHPKVMEARIKRKNWEFDYDISFSRRPLKDKVKSFCRRYLGWNLYYKNYKVLK